MKIKVMTLEKGWLTSNACQQLTGEALDIAVRKRCEVIRFQKVENAHPK